MSVYVQLSEEWGQTLKSFCSMYILISFWRASEMHLRKKYKEQWVVRIMEDMDFSVGRDRIEWKPGSWRKTKPFVRKSKWSCTYSYMFKCIFVKPHFFVGIYIHTRTYIHSIFYLFYLSYLPMHYKLYAGHASICIQTYPSFCMCIKINGSQPFSFLILIC